MFCAPSAAFLPSASHLSFLPFPYPQVHYPLPLRLQHPPPSSSVPAPPPSCPSPPPTSPRQDLRTKAGREGVWGGGRTAAALHRAYFTRETASRKKIQELEVGIARHLFRFLTLLNREADS